MVQLRCPSCRSPHWVIDCDFRGAELIGKKELTFAERTYSCPSCRYSGQGYAVLQKSPPEFFMQPHGLYPMSQQDFDQWVDVLKENFPNDPMLDSLNKDWYPSGESKRRSGPLQWFRRFLGRT
jgi:hypothetical protein